MQTWSAETQSAARLFLPPQDVQIGQMQDQRDTLNAQIPSGG
jgi:hypothetical protein